MINNIKSLIFVFFLSALLGGSIFAQSHFYDPSLRSDQKQIADEPWDEVLALLQEGYLFPEKLQIPLPDQTISGYLQSLEDPYTQYFTPQQAKKFLQLLNNQIVGIGAVMKQSKNGVPQIVSLLDNSPAKRAGLQIGDFLLGVDKTFFQKNQTLNSFLDNVRGPEGSRAFFYILRGKEILKIAIERAKVVIPPVKSLHLGKKCYMSIANFDRGSAKNFKAAFSRRGECREFIFDLRDNPGGIIDEVLEILELFVESDKVLLGIESKNAYEQKLSKSSLLSSSLPKTTIVINAETASAGEIFAGVLKHYFPEKVSLIGEKSYGKGSMQELSLLSNGGLFKYTIGLWYLGDQKSSIDKLGLPVDINIVDDPYTLQDEVLAYLGIIKI